MNREDRPSPEESYRLARVDLGRDLADTTLLLPRDVVPRGCRQAGCRWVAVVQPRQRRIAVCHNGAEAFAVELRLLRTQGALMRRVRREIGAYGCGVSGDGGFTAAGEADDGDARE